MEINEPWTNWGIIYVYSWENFDLHIEVIDGFSSHSFELNLEGLWTVSGMIGKLVSFRHIDGEICIQGGAIPLECRYIRVRRFYGDMATLLECAEALDILVFTQIVLRWAIRSLICRSLFITINLKPLKLILHVRFPIIDILIAAYRLRFKVL